MDRLERGRKEADPVDTVVQLTASALTILGMYLYGNKSALGPLIGIAAQVPWWLIMFTGSLWGLLPVNSMMLVIHIRNLIKWRRDARQAAESSADTTAVR
jgi:hypothetical protein